LNAGMCVGTPRERERKRKRKSMVFQQCCRPLPFLVWISGGYQPEKRESKSTHLCTTWYDSQTCVYGCVCVLYEGEKVHS
jgi:hypothetical protein